MSQPNTSTLAGKIAVMQFKADNTAAVVQRKRKLIQYTEWCDCDCVVQWNWGEYDYRIKPPDQKSKPVPTGQVTYCWKCLGTGIV